MTVVAASVDARRPRVEAVGMTPDEAIGELRSGQVRPLYLVVGDESYRAAEVVDAIVAATDTGPRGFNDDKFMASETDAETVVNAARTAPMMATRRLVLVRGVERWDGKGGKQTEGALDRLAEYATDPVPSSVMVLVATKINGSRKIMRAAKKQGFLVSCQTLSRRELPGWVKSRAKAMGHRIDHPTAEALCELVGPELGPVNDALERLSLYVGLGRPITEDAITEVVTRVRQDTVWALVDALSARNLEGAMAALHDAYEPRDNGLPLLGAIGWRSRQLLKFQAALKSASPSDAARSSGVPPFKANELARIVRALSARTLESWLLLLAEADLALKGSKRNGLDVLSTMLVEMTRTD